MERFTDNPRRRLGMRQLHQTQDAPLAPSPGDPVTAPEPMARTPDVGGGMEPPVPDGGMLTGLDAAITDRELLKANEALNRYRAGKANLDRRVIAAEDWWKLRHWAYMEGFGNKKDDHTPSAWLFNCIISKHADGLEAFPEPNILPREPGDKEEAQKLSSIVPVVLEQNEFEDTYSQVLWQKLRQGTGIYGVFWDKDKLNGLGDIAVRKMDILNLFWEPGVTDIQKSRYMFTTELVDIELLKEQYPMLADKPLTGKTFVPSEYRYDDHVDTTDKAVVVDWYYHKRVGGKNVLHYVKYVDQYVLYATENDPALRDKGLYDHGLYPFVFDPLFPIEGSPAGYGYIDVGKGPQQDIDRMNQAMVKATIMSSHPRFFIRSDGAVNEAEFADFAKPLVHVTNSQLGDDSIRQIEVSPMPAIAANYLDMKIGELKETTGNRDTTNGGTQQGVTAAAAIAAMQEQAGKTSRASTMSAYRAYSKMVLMVIELIRQFYNLPRQFRILGSNGEEQFVTLDNSGLAPQPQAPVMGVDMGMRLPVFDIDVSAQKMSSYTKVAQNELALQLYQMGILNPQNADQALTLLDIMDFNHKDLIEEKIRKNAAMYQLLTMYQQAAITLAAQSGQSDIAEALAQNAMGVQQMLNPQQMGGKNVNIAQPEDPMAKKRDNAKDYYERARAKSAAATQPEA